MAKTSRKPKSSVAAPRLRAPVAFPATHSTFPTAHNGASALAFLFRDGRNQLYKVAFDGKLSHLYAWTQSRWLHVRPVTDPTELEIFMANETHPPEVDPIGRNFFLVKSLSRPDIGHIVDLDANEFSPEPACSCEQNRFRKCKCHHLQAVEEFLAWVR